MRRIDPVEALLNLIRTDVTAVTLTNGQIANQHKFNLNDNASLTAWHNPSAAITLTPAGEPTTSRANLLTGRFTVNCYGESPENCMRVWNTVAEIANYHERRTIATNNGTAMLYSLSLDTSPTQLFDDGLNLDYLSGSMRYHMFAYAVEDCD